MKAILLLIAILFCCSTSNILLAQQTGFGVKGGLTIGLQKELYPLVSYHGDIFYESLTEWKGDTEGKQSRIGFVGQLGYHRKGVSYTNGRSFGGNAANYSIEDVFHNISVAALLKGSYQWGKFAPYWAGGIRGDVTVDFDLVSDGQVNVAQPQVNRVMLGFWLGGGIEWEAPKSPFGFFIEINVSPDLTPQVVKRERLVFNQSTGLYSVAYINPAEKILNIALEVSAGVKFINRPEWEDEILEAF